MSKTRCSWLWTILKLLVLAGLAWTVCFIFSNSMQTAAVSSGASGRVLALLQDLLRRLGHPGLAARLTDHIVRKLAHFCEYMLEGFFLVLVTRVAAGRHRHLLPYLSWPALAGVLTALTDETIQLFFQGRGSRVTDVWIDFGGVVAGMLAGLVFLALLRALFGALFGHHPREPQS